MPNFMKSQLTQVAVFLAVSTLASCSFFDPWSGCPEEQQCLAGDIVTREAKSCCGEDQVCYSDKAMYGGTCISKREAAERAARRKKAPRKEIRDTGIKPVVAPDQP
jgi:hypothetical protein